MLKFLLIFKFLQIFKSLFFQTIKIHKHFNQNPFFTNTPSFPFQTQFGDLRSASANVGRSSDPSPQTPINLTPTSQYSQFSSHDGLDAIDLNNEEIEYGGQDCGHWQWEEDKLLISAWLNVSMDPVVGTDKKGDAFWKRIHEY